MIEVDVMYIMYRSVHQFTIDDTPIFYTSVYIQGVNHSCLYIPGESGIKTH